MRQVPDKEFVAVSTLDGPGRYRHFVGCVADWEQVWSLRSQDGWVLAADDDGREAMPVWPHARYAAACATGQWVDTEPVAVPVREWFEEWLPRMSDGDRCVAVFPTPEGRGVLVHPDKMREDLERELARCE